MISLAIFLPVEWEETELKQDADAIFPTEIQISFSESILELIEKF